MRKAVFEARKLGEFEIVEYLELITDPDTDDIEQLTDNLISTLDAAGRHEEALTLKLIHLNTLAAFTVTYIEFSIEQQKDLKRETLWITSRKS